MMELESLKKKKKSVPVSPLAPPPREENSGQAPVTESARVWILHFPASRTVRNKLLLLTSNPLCEFLLWQPKQAKTEELQKEVSRIVNFLSICKCLTF